MRKLINDGWQFVKLPAGSTKAEADKASPVSVDLPHDWLIWQDDLYETADAWYFRDIELPADHDPVVMIRFDGVYMDCDVLLNDVPVCTHPYGYTAFDADLTGKLNPGKNRLTVHIRHRSPNSRWYSGSGIYRDVTLVTLPEDHLVPDGVYLKEEKTDGSWKLHISAETAGTHRQPFLCTLYDGEGRETARAEGCTAEHRTEACLTVPDAHLWSPEDPYLYTLQIQYGKQTEVFKTGLRSVFAEAGKGLLLNGRKIKLRGVCLHHDLGALGAAFHPKAARRQLNLMKEMGANAVRTSHNPPASAFLDLCDEMGILVIDEAFDMWERAKTPHDYARFFPEWYQRDTASWIRRDRRHPSVIMWSVGNEIPDMHADMRGSRITEALKNEVRIHDPLGRAFVTFGCNYMPWEGGQRCAEHVDIVGYNYGEKLYARHRKTHPSWIIYGSETGSVLSSRGIYHFPVEQSIMSDTDEQCSALGNSNTSWGAESLRRILAADLEDEDSLGQFLWSGIDYIGEPTPYHTRCCYFGQADTACFPKDPYYLVQSFWTDSPMIHIGVSWDWNRGQMIDIPVMTNCREAELFLNGRSLGRKRNDLHDGAAFPLLWKIPFEAGELKAAGYDAAGRQVSGDRRLTAGETDHLVLRCENACLQSDGWDLVFVTVSAEDRDNRPVENARDRVKVTVTGGGRLIGTDNGDSTDTDSYKSDCRRLFSGKLLLIIASNGKAEDVHIHAEGNSCRGTDLTVPVRECPRKPGVSSMQTVCSQPLNKTISVRRVALEALGDPALTPENPECVFRCKVLPACAADTDIRWEACNASGIEAPGVRLEAEGDCVTVRAAGDGNYYLRAVCMQEGRCALISQREFSASGFGNPAADPYSYISAGLYDLHEGEIGAGNEKGIAFARDARSMIGFSRVDFGKNGSDRITADIFALSNDPFDLEFSAVNSRGEEQVKTLLHYEKPSIWNVYQPETWTLPERLTGVQTLCFRMTDKVHMKGFVFEKQTGAWLSHSAASADRIYGDQYRISGTSVTDIGNNVTLTWEDLDFEGAEEAVLEIRGKTPLAVNPVTVRIRNDRGEEITDIADFDGQGPELQRFGTGVLEGNCSVSFVFLPGSVFDFHSFRFLRQQSWTESAE